MVETEKMTETEKLAYNWFLSQGYKPTEISFSPYRHIDFIVAGKPYEVKRLYQKNAIYTTKNQYDELKDPNVTILVFDEGCTEPVFTGPLKEIKNRFKTFGLPKIRGYVDTELIKRVQEKFPQTKALKSTSDIIQYVFLKVLEDPVEGRLKNGK